MFHLPTPAQLRFGVYATLVLATAVASSHEVDVAGLLAICTALLLGVQAFVGSLLFRGAFPEGERYYATAFAGGLAFALADHVLDAVLVRVGLRAHDDYETLFSTSGPATWLVLLLGAAFAVQAVVLWLVRELSGTRPPLTRTVGAFGFQFVSLLMVGQAVKWLHTTLAAPFQ